MQGPTGTNFRRIIVGVARRNKMDDDGDVSSESVVQVERDMHPWRDAGGRPRRGLLVPFPRIPP